MHCLRCGAALPGSAKFCPSCGQAESATATVGVTGEMTRAAARDAAAAPPTHRTPTAAAGERGWLTGSDSLGHGRFTPGTILDSRYRIVGLLGRGGMGEVYRADDLRLGQPVALKLLPAGLNRDPVRLAQFHNEVRIARQVSHPNVCRVYDIGEADGLLYLSMEYVDGEDLASSLRRIGRFPEDRAVELARQLCAGVAAAHQRGVIHRDLKPANVMLDGAGRVRVMDFGLAAVGAVENVRAGTPAYMAPEQLLGREVTARSDIFALGLVLYELFTGRRAFAAATVGELVSQHESRSLTPPSAIVTALDPAVERAILRCLEPDPADRPPSALALSAALPGGDPLAAALEAGETPSPEMVAAAGQGAGLEPRIAWAVLLAVLTGMTAALALSVRASALDDIQPQYPPEVLAQKARDAIARLGYPERPRDHAYGFEWDERLAGQLRQRVGADGSPASGGRPSPLFFWYRQSPEALIAITFHTDLLTPGIVYTDDPPATTSGMIEVALDHAGLLTSLEAIPPQRLDAPAPSSPVDWSAVFDLAGIDAAQLQAADPLWTFLAASDTRAAWTGAWPGSNRPLRVEAAALGGRPTAVRLVDPATYPSRMPDPAEDVVDAGVVALMALAVSILAGASLLAVKNLRAARGDRRGASRLALVVIAILLALWACQVHLVASPVFIAIFLLAVCTSVFYGVLHGTLYLAVEPFVRRYWPQVLVSVTNVLSGRARDPVVGRDVLFGAALGVAWAVILRGLNASGIQDAPPVFPGAPEVLLGVRATLGVVLEEAPYAIRNAFLYFFLLFVLRIVLRNQWLAALAFASLFAVLSATTTADSPVANGLVTFVYFGTGAVALLRLGLLTMAVGSFVMGVLMDVPATLDTSAWYFGNMMLLVGIVVALAAWAAHTSTGGRLVEASTFGTPDLGVSAGPGAGRRFHR